MAEELGQLGQQIQQLTEESLTASLMNAPQEPEGFYYLQQPKALAAALTLAAPKWHAERLESPAELAKFIQDRIDRGILNGDPAIFYGKESVALVYNLITRRDVATCILKPSAQFLTLTKQAGVCRSQKDFIRDLRVIYRNCLSDNSLINNLRGIKWGNSDTGGAEIQHGKESMGRQIINQVQGMDIIPEEITLTLPVFENHPFRTTIQCAVDINPEARSFALTPFPQEVHNAMENTLDDILLGLDKDKFPPAFRGSAF